MVLLDAVFIPLFLYIGHLSIQQVVNRNGWAMHKKLLIKLLYYHILLGLLFGLYVTIFGGDSIGYWRSPARFMASGESWFVLHKTGTPFVYFLTYPFSQVLGLSFWAGTILFSIIGFLGFICIFILIVKYIGKDQKIFEVKLFPIVLFLPNMHFWSGGIGKDTIMFFALSLFIFALTNPVRNILLIILSFYLAYFVRPHIALLMLVGLGGSMLISTKGISFALRIFFLVVAIYSFVVISPAVFEFIKIDAEEINEFSDISMMRAKNLSRSQTGSAIDISNYSIGMKIFTFLFRPLFFDLPTFFGFLISVENLFYLVLASALIKFRNLGRLLQMPAFLKASFIVLAATAFFMSSSLGNLGIIIRQKNMVMFMFLLVILYLMQLDRIDSTKESAKLKWLKVRSKAKSISKPSFNDLKEHRIYKR
jgi:hypothetical protein